jgi:peroxiredoxin Q/BCP
MVGPAVGETAPDFDFLGITRYGVLKERHKLSDYHGKTIVLAFFPKARTKG